MLAVQLDDDQVVTIAETSNMAFLEPVAGCMEVEQYVSGSHASASALRCRCKASKMLRNADERYAEAHA